MTNQRGFRLYRWCGSIWFWLLLIVVAGRAQEVEFPRELVRFTAYPGNPVFTAAPGQWDARIRERGWILREGDQYRLWYTGYANEPSALRKLGYATSPDGIHWTRYAGNPIYSDHWIEDMMVVKFEGTYYMVAEGKDDIAQLLTSPDGLHWTRTGPLDIRLANGKPISPGPYGTPVLWREGPTWYLFYERNDSGVWLATSKDMKVWTNVLDDPVLGRGPESYDRYAVALNQVIRYHGRYYGYYHGADSANWKEWSTNVAASNDLVHWKKYAGNPILKENKSSGIMVDDGKQYRLYTMHDKVQLHFPAP